MKKKRLYKEAKKGLQTGDHSLIKTAEGLTKDELEKALTLFDQARIKEQIREDNLQRFRDLTQKRRKEGGLG
ncbi:unnamed protein product [Didymodactylos carnosus]|uniref:Uncharacterized protein n=1 Tax=Didymodactylos carnosus TaxID=1234261 RepID=A0A8S2FRM7_9BILA|nr:unnamed protein product [Didymodactylos carnosus]CAF4315816.1 unnamed protein product [Didymodactylos carnosus]